MDGTDQLNSLTGRIIGAAMKVHTRLGPGLLEHTYRRCLAYELRKLGLKVEEEVRLDLVYDDLLVLAAYRMDIVVENAVVIEVKTTNNLQSVHHSQIVTYLKLGQKPIGLLLNFHVQRLSDGVRRFVNNL
jgi:GxxExxY protein